MGHVGMLEGSYQWQTTLQFKDLYCVVEASAIGEQYYRRAFSLGTLQINLKKVQKIHSCDQ